MLTPADIKSGFGKLSEAQVQLVRELLNSGQSIRAVAKLLGFSRHQVTAISKGVPRKTIESPFRWTSCGRCRECGALVNLPCLACKLRSERCQRQI